MTADRAQVRRYHNGTKHHFDRYARSLGYLDWASQPKPFREFHGSTRRPLFPAPGADPPLCHPQAAYAELVSGASSSRVAVDFAGLGFFLRHAFGLSAWKVFQGQRWSLRVNPSSGNLHPTEAYLTTGDRVWHYLPEQHALEERCRFDSTLVPPLPDGTCLVILTSIHWREAWKYGERAFRYCHHDIGHAIAAVRFSAALCGWQARLLDDWSPAELAALSGVDREQDFVEAEGEEPACALLISGSLPVAAPERTALLAAARSGSWTGQASQLSVDHVQWTIIDEVCAATRSPIVSPAAPIRRDPVAPAGPAAEAPPGGATDAATVLLRRRSAVAFDAVTPMGRSAFFTMLTRLRPTQAPPWDALPWAPRIHLLLFVHRVADLDPGLYLMPRSDRGGHLLQRSSTRAFTWEVVDPDLPLIRLAVGDCRRLARRVSCDQDIAADGAFSLGMLADFAASIDEQGAAVYRRLFWEAGVVGHQLYLDAEALGFRGTGIGCFFDDAVHDILGLQDDALQSLYHFTVGTPVEDRRLTTEPGYLWEK